MLSIDIELQPIRGSLLCNSKLQTKYPDMLEINFIFLRFICTGSIALIFDEPQIKMKFISYILYFVFTSFLFIL